MKNSMRRRIRNIIASLCALSTLSANSVGAWNKDNAACVALRGQDGNVLDSSPCPATAGIDKASILNCQAYPANSILLENGMILTGQGDVLLLPKANTIALQENNGVTTATVAAGIAGAGLGNANAAEYALHLDGNATIKLKELILGDKFSGNKNLSYDASVLTKASLGKSVTIDDAGCIRKGNLYLKNGSLGKQTPEWTADQNDAGPKLTVTAKKALMTLGYLTKDVAWELTHAKELHLDENNKLRGDDDSYRNYAGEKVDESNAVEVPVNMSNGVERTDFRNYDQWRTQLILVPCMNSTRKVADMGKSDSMAGIFTIKCAQGDKGTMAKIDAFLTCDQKMAYCKDGKWRPVKDVVKTKNVDEQIMPATDAAKKMGLDLKNCVRGSLFYIFDRMGTRARIVSGVGGTVLVVGVAGGIIYAISTIRPSKTNASSRIKNKPTPVPTDRAPITNAIT